MSGVRKFLQVLSRIFRKIGVTAYSKKKNIWGLHPIVVSTLVIVITCSIANLLRKIARITLNDGLLKELLFEFIATAEMCACAFELIVIADNYGLFMYGVYLFFLTVWWSNSWENASACPYNALEDVVEGNKELENALMVIGIQLLGGVVIFRYVQLIWALELVETHRGIAFQQCQTDLQVPMIEGAVIEGVATLMCRIASRALSESQIRFANVLDAFFATTLVVIAFNLSGGYFNPALATALKYGCKGDTIRDHVMVYWVGSCAGSLASVFLYRTQFVQSYVKQLSLKED